jgi:hypothetical protein
LGREKVKNYAKCPPFGIFSTSQMKRKIVHTRQCPSSQIFWRINTMKMKANEAMHWSQVLAVGRWRWQSGSRDVELEESDNTEVVMVMNDRQRGNMAWKWKPVTLALLFSSEKPPQSRLPPEEIDVESRLMEVLAELEEHERPDDGEVEIPSDEVFVK